VTRAQDRLLLAARRELLVQSAQQQREQLARSLEPLLRASVWIERGLGLRRALRGRPGLALVTVLAPAALLALWRPRAVLRTLATALALWRAGRSVQRAWNATRARDVGPLH
jgi:YqjK-like protein